MDTIIVAAIVGVIVGAFSGLLGSIAGPFLNYRLDRQRRSEKRQEERNQELRRMLETVMRISRTTVTTTAEIELAVMDGTNVGDVLQRHNEYIRWIENLQPHFSWRPHRIHDDALRRLAVAFLSAQTQLAMLVRAAGGDPITSTLNWFQRMRNVRPWVESLSEAVDQRMDELDW